MCESYNSSLILYNSAKWKYTDLCLKCLNRHFTTISYKLYQLWNFTKKTLKQLKKN